MDEKENKGPVTHIMRSVDPAAGNNNGGRPPAPPHQGNVPEPERPNEAAWIEAYIARASEPIDFDPVERRIRNRKLAAIEAETLNSERTATKIVAETAPFIPLPPARDPWEDPIDGK